MYHIFLKNTYHVPDTEYEWIQTEQNNAFTFVLMKILVMKKNVVKGMESIGKNQATIDINSLQPAAEPASPAERHAAGGCGEGVCGKS